MLLCNPWSGGGKVATFGLAELAAELGVETVFLDKGLDLAQLAYDAIANGADCLGMAGGDGSQALVASIAIEHDIPFVCISAGTRNHFALDLGLEKEDPRTGMVAFRDGIERRVDYATVDDRLFVNNVSLGIYATIVQQEGYREAKKETSRALLPELLGRQAEPFDLQFSTPDGTEVDGAFMILVSNNPYVLGPAMDISQRRSMTTGTLGVVALTARTGAEAAAMIARSTVGLSRRDSHIYQFACETFEIRSRSGKVFAGVDGESLELDSPLQLRHPPGRPAAAGAGGQRGSSGPPQRPRLRLRRPRRGGTRATTALGAARRRTGGPRCRLTNRARPGCGLLFRSSPGSTGRSTSRSRRPRPPPWTPACATSACSPTSRSCGWESRPCSPWQAAPGDGARQ